MNVGSQAIKEDSGPRKTRRWREGVRVERMERRGVGIRAPHAVTVVNLRMRTLLVNFWEIHK